MRYLLKTFFITFFTIISSNVISAVNVVECEDHQGNRSFHKICPPNYTQISEKKLNTGNTESINEKRMSSIQATLYVIPECEACEEIKEFFGNRNILFVEKNVNDNFELQQELTEIAGSLKVPTTVIGDEILTGYSRSKFLSVLEATGYTE